MKIISNIELRNFNAWSGAKETKEIILNEGKGNYFDAFIDDLYPDGLTDTELNDLLWFEGDWIFETLGIEIED